jgi:two-component system cell cycle sensor histidine kinase/response regulator CckA
VPQRHDEGATIEMATILDAALDAVIRMDARGSVTGWNDRATDTFGWPASEAVGQPLASLIIPPQHREAHRSGLDRFLASGTGPIIGRRLEITAVHRDGREFPIELAVTALRPGDEWEFVAFLRDISARKRDEMLRGAIYRIAQAANTLPGLPELLRQIHSIVGELLPAQNFYIALHDESTNLLTFPYFADEREPPPPPRAYGRGLTEYVLRTREPCLAPPERCRQLQALGEIVMMGPPSLDWMGVPLFIEDRPIGVVVIQAYETGIRFGERELGILQFVSTQIAMAIERKRVDAELLDSENRYRMLFDANPEAMCVCDAESQRVIDVNDAAIRRYGYSRDEFLTMTIGALEPPSGATGSQPGLSGPGAGPRLHTDLRHRRRDGSIIDVEIATNEMVISNRPARLVLLRDVTERKQLEGHFRQAQKMEAVGQLAGGVAHDFNNLLTAIIGFSDLLLADLTPGDQRRNDVDQIRDAARQAAGLTQQLLAFSRKQMLQPRVVDINEIVTGSEKLLQRLIGENIALTTALDPALGAVRADPAQLEQVIVNLAVNARDAMPDGGTLVIETANAELDSSYTAEHSLVSPGGYVRLAVTDTGTGIHPATQARLFEPFFTTKGPGKGTGLGLSTVYGIVKQSGGFIWVYSEPGKGATFKIYLPRVDAPVERLGAASSPALRRGTETVLLVEDESALRAVARRALERQGYEVLEAPDAAAALAIAAGRGGAIDLVVTDVVMPGMSGAELALRFTALHPGVPFLFMSGYTDEAIVRHGVLEPGVAFIQKPFSPDALARKVGEILDRAK